MLYLETGSGLTLADTLRASGVIIDVGYNANPDVVDWNGDGKKDILIGTETGYVRLYLNRGTNSNPVFTTYTNIPSGGSPIYIYRSNPRVFDLDQDGKKDLVVGDGYGYIHFFRNTGTNNNPSFSGSDTLRTNNGLPIDDYYGARPYCNDWNQDGRIDILTSGYDGYVTYYQNIINPGVEENASDIVSNLILAPSIVKGAVTITYTLARTTRVNIDLISIDGRLVQTIMDRDENAGIHQHSWNRGNIASGFYFIRINAGDSSITRKVILL